MADEEKDDGGVYGVECALLRNSLMADGIALVVINGAKGSGFSLQLAPEHIPHMAALFRKAADDMEQRLLLLTTPHDPENPNG